jgi:hypothetical protein
MPSAGDVHARRGDAHGSRLRRFLAFAAERVAATGAVALQRS